MLLPDLNNWPHNLTRPKQEGDVVYPQNLFYAVFFLHRLSVVMFLHQGPPCVEGEELGRMMRDGDTGAIKRIVHAGRGQLTTEHDGDALLLGSVVQGGQVREIIQVTRRRATRDGELASGRVREGM